MSENLINNYAFIKCAYPDYEIVYNTTISYIKTLSGVDKVLFLCKKDKNSILNEVSYTPTKKSSSKKTDLDLTGSPLKDDCVFDDLETSLAVGLEEKDFPWTKVEENYIGISVQKAKQILNNMLFESKDFSTEGSFWVLCDATDTFKTVLCEIGFNAHWNTRGDVLYKGIILTEEVNIQNLLSAHLSQIKGTNKVDTTFDCFFNIASNTTLKLNWSSSSLQPVLNNYKNCDIILYQKFQIGNTNSVAEHFWRQLVVLSIIKDDIIDYKTSEDENKEPVYQCGSGIDMETLREQVISIMTEVTGDCYEVHKFESNDIEVIIDKTKDRMSLDVTDRLWDLLKFCASYKDLKTAFSFIFQCAAKCNVVNMPPNQNRLAEIIREVSQHRLAVPCLTGSEPMELLLEIGLEKLYKDYEFIFSEKKICGIKDLDFNKKPNIPTTNITETPAKSVRKSLHSAVQQTPLDKTRKTLLHTNNNRESTGDGETVGFQNSRFNKKDVEYKLAKLAQIHLILEHILLVQINLNLDNVCNDICEHLLKAPLRKFSDLKRLDCDRLEMPLTTDSILHNIESKDPHARRISMTSQNFFKKVLTVHYYTMDNIFPSHAIPGIATDEKEMSKKNVYHSYQYTRIYSKRCKNHS